jgi:hypothetical protein
MMRVILALYLLGCPAMAMAASPEPAAQVAPVGTPYGAEDRARIQDVISRQLEAFRHDDGDAAFGFASPGIRQLFGNADNFMAMVRQGYPQVHRAREAEFRELVEMNGQPAQRVVLIGPDGQVVVALYPMERQPDGSWRIDGCLLVKADETTA